MKSILLVTEDIDGNTIAEATDNIIEYDGGCFSAEEIF